MSLGGREVRKGGHPATLLGTPWKRESIWSAPLLQTYQELFLRRLNDSICIRSKASNRVMPAAVVPPHHTQCGQKGSLQKRRPEE